MEVFIAMVADADFKVKHGHVLNDRKEAYLLSKPAVEETGRAT